MASVAQFSESYTIVKTFFISLRYFFTGESALELRKHLNKELKSGLIAGGSTIHALPARKNYITKILQQQDSGSRKCDASDDSDSNKRPYAYDAMSAGSIIERNYTDLPGAK